MDSLKGLRLVNLKSSYNTSRHDLSRDFFVPLLARAIVYDRGVGYFSSGWLARNAAGLAEFAMRSGHVRWVTSPILSEQDLIALSKANDLTQAPECLESLFCTVDELRDALENDTLNTMAWMVADGLLEFRFAIPTEELDGDFHDKFGIFADEYGQRVSFLGSYNDTLKGFRNYESIRIFLSWEANTVDAVNEDEQRFARIWLGQEPNLKIYDLPEAVRQRLIQCRTDDRPYPIPFIYERKSSITQVQETTSGFTLNKWRHQDEAVERFLNAERGVLNMATGTGKTRTALRIMKVLFDRNEIDTVIISMFGTDLLNQWYAEILQRLSEIDKMLLVYRHYDKHRERQEFGMNPQSAILLSSHHSLAKTLQNINNVQGSRTLLIYDEVHRLGSPENRDNLNTLSNTIRFRLGLSATPEREYDQDGNDFIEQHVGPVLMTFGLEEAITRGILAPFHYYPLEYEITVEDRQRIQGVYAKQSARAKAGKPMPLEEVWIELARIYKTSTAKLPVFDEFIEHHQHLLERCIIFVETMEYGEQVLEIVHKYRPDFHTYFSGEDSDTLRRFANGDLECLIACHRLSEGIDIRSLNSVILFSSSRARLETIQRIGRCLRTDPQNPAKVANIVDFIRVSTGDDIDPNADEERAAWLTELSQIRVQE